MSEAFSALLKFWNLQNSKFLKFSKSPKQRSVYTNPTAEQGIRWILAPLRAFLKGSQDKHWFGKLACFWFDCLAGWLFFFKKLENLIWDSNLVLTNTVTTGHVWQFKFILIVNRIKKSVPQSHQAHSKSSADAAATATLLAIADPEPLHHGRKRFLIALVWTV